MCCVAGEFRYAPMDEPMKNGIVAQIGANTDTMEELGRCSHQVRWN